MPIPDLTERAIADLVSLTGRIAVDLSSFMTGSTLPVDGGELA